MFNYSTIINTLSSSAKTASNQSPSVPVGIVAKQGSVATQHRRLHQATPHVRRLERKKQFPREGKSHCPLRVSTGY